MRYAVIRINGNQYKVKEGETILLDYFGGSKPEAEVLLISDGENIRIGKPVLKNSSAKLKIVDEKVKGDKLTVQKFKAKSRYRRRSGFRPVHTKLLVEKII